MELSIVPSCVFSFKHYILKDFGMQFSIMGESFETSVPWDKVISLCRNVKEVIRREGIASGTILPPLASCR